ncbi:Rieske 2Fe-2S domain-containing protein, partial [Candidatus Woesearchaeota archaeon]|nr:Rieske 2Fe-2S domain-containing protein [Candidatus Woesearchaeota archaeon]
MIKVASKSEIKEGQMKKVEIQDKEILLVNVKGKIYAIENKC